MKISFTIQRVIKWEKKLEKGTKLLASAAHRESSSKLNFMIEPIPMEIDLNFMQIFGFFSSSSSLSRWRWWSFSVIFSLLKKFPHSAARGAPRMMKNLYLIDTFLLGREEKREWVRWNECVSVVEIEYWNFIFIHFSIRWEQATVTDLSASDENTLPWKFPGFTCCCCSPLKSHHTLQPATSITANCRKKKQQAQVEFTKSIHNMEKILCSSRLWRL